VAHKLAIRDSDGPTGTCRAIIDFGAFICPPAGPERAPVQGSRSPPCPK
jgi:hypothetical protein